MTHKEKIVCDTLIANYVNLVNSGRSKEFPEWSFTSNTPANLIDLISAELPDECWYVSTLKFDISLDWSMTVLEKIQSEGYTWTIGTTKSIDKFYCEIFGVGTYTGNTPQEVVYLAIVEFIKYKKSLPTENKIPFFQ